MKLVPITAKFEVPETEASDFLSCNFMVIPHIPAELENLLSMLAQAERGVEASGDAEAIAAFQWLGGLFARAHVVGRQGMTEAKPSKGCDA